LGGGDSVNDRAMSRVLASRYRDFLPAQNVGRIWETHGRGGAKSVRQGMIAK
jgi:hypothetical protein